MKRNLNLAATGVALALAVAAQGGCAGSAKVVQPSAPAQQPAVNESQSAIVLKGKVVETMDAGKYTYFCLEKDGKKGWVAVLRTQEVNVGDEVEVQPGTEMGKFTSKALNRTFDNIVFSTGIVPKK